MATSRTEICNFALGLISDKSISDINDKEDVNAKLCLLHYQQTLDEELRAYAWNGAFHEAKLAQKPTEESPLIEYEFAYSLPNNPFCLRPLRVNDGVENFIISGRLLFSDNDNIILGYTKRITNIAEMDPLLVKVLYTQLAIKLSFPITQSTKIGDKLLRDYETLVAPLAKFIDSIETRPRFRDRSNFVESRGNEISSQSGFTAD